MTIPYHNEPTSKKSQVRIMFNNIATHYDSFNHILSLGIDKNWRKKLKNKIITYLHENKITHPLILDLATGTGDVAFNLANIPDVTITGIDLSEKMIDVANKKLVKSSLKNLSFSVADGENLPFADHSFDIATISFGIRNYENIPQGLQEIFRVLKPSGVLFVLEFSKIKSPILRFFFSFHFQVLIPLFGKIFSKDKKAYSYLPESVKNFPDRNVFTMMLKHASFEKTTTKTLTFGIATIYESQKTR